MEINAGTYRIIAERGSLSALGSLAAETLRPCRALIVSDDRVFPLYGKAAADSLAAAGFVTAAPFVFPHGEQSKTFAVLEALLAHLAEEEMTRSDVLFALGGGVTGDLTGFAAAVWLRGVRFVQIPTSLLAMVDSSVGGKTAVDLPAGKNLAGAFHEPSLVVCDPDLLATLPEECFADGMAEIVKMGMLGDAELLPLLKAGAKSRLTEVIVRAVSDKRDVVSRDLYDRGERQKLNFGHTFGHAIELLSDYGVSHGQAVASGMALITNFAVKSGFCPPETNEMLLDLLRQYALPAELWREYSPDVLCRAALHDKKRRGGGITLVLPRSAGSCELREFPVDGLVQRIACAWED